MLRNQKPFFNSLKRYFLDYLLFETILAKGTFNQRCVISLKMDRNNKHFLFLLKMTNITNFYFCCNEQNNNLIISIKIDRNNKQFLFLLKWTEIINFISVETNSINKSQMTDEQS